MRLFRERVWRVIELDGRYYLRGPSGYVSGSYPLETAKSRADNLNHHLEVQRGATRAKVVH